MRVKKAKPGTVTRDMVILEVSPGEISIISDACQYYMNNLLNTASLIEGAVPHDGELVILGKIERVNRVLQLLMPRVRAMAEQLKKERLAKQRESKGVHTEPSEG